jgi:hypothetical protein
VNTGPQAIQNMGDQVLTMQKETIATEISNIFWGLAKCLMYKPGMVSSRCFLPFYFSTSVYFSFLIPSPSLSQFWHCT